MNAQPEDASPAENLPIMKAKKVPAPELYPVVLRKAARYNWRDKIVNRGEIMRVSAADRNHLIKSGHFKDFVKEEPIVLVSEPMVPEGEEAFNPPPEIIGRVPTPAETEGSIPVMEPDTGRTVKRGGGPRRGSTALNEAAQAG